MNQIQLNEFGIAELLAADLRQIEALANSAEHLLSSIDASVYLQDAAELMKTIQRLTSNAELLRNEWQKRIPRVNCPCRRCL